uniref:HEEH mini protein HEEH_TK_rd5_0341 n=1 Tax=Escherichia coli TaxID=562 RepID=UPI0021CDE85A|nr:Chain A, HEEH mini protein HEEH_TK_rd5_0341 [Escherichia coli]7T2F_B Chain B, HEEH mini protein HEEH_TK_rd5_0341 [Escherichia coli]
SGLVPRGSHMDLEELEEDLKQALREGRKVNILGIEVTTEEQARRLIEFLRRFI